MKHNKRLRLYKILIIFFLIVAFVWPRFLAKDAEIDNRALAIAIGIDVNNDDDRGEVLASAQILVPIPQGQQVGRQEVYFGTGKTLAEALFFINVKIGRILDFGQVGLIVFGEEKAKQGVLDDLKYLINNKVRAESTLFVAEGNEAREVLQKANNLSEEATSSLNNLLKFNAQSTYMPNINMLHFISDSLVTDKSSFIPILNIEPRDVITLSDGTIVKKKEKASESPETPTKAESASALIPIKTAAPLKTSTTVAASDYSSVTTSLEKPSNLNTPFFANLDSFIDTLETSHLRTADVIGATASSADVREPASDSLGQAVLKPEYRGENESYLYANSSSEGEGGTGGGELNEIKDVDRVFLFRDGKLVDKLNIAQTKGLVWHNADAHFGLVVAENIKIDDKIIERLPCDLREKSVKSKVAFIGSKPVITYKFNLRFNTEDLHEINENHDSSRPLVKKEINSKIREALMEYIKRDMNNCLDALREKNVDALRIEHQFYKFKHKDYKKYIKDNPNFLHNVEVRCEFKIKVY